MAKLSGPIKRFNQSLGEGIKRYAIFECAMEDESEFTLLV